MIALVLFSVLRSTKTAAPAPTAESTAAQVPPITQTPADTGAQAMPPMASPRGAAPAPAPMTTPAVLTEPEPTKEEVVGVPRTKPEDVLQGLEAHALTIIDVRDADSYKERHIPGALHIPLAYIAGEVPYLPRDKPIVTYCT
ncbi:MAG TPA: rhodanese-like domain-containing protein [Thermoanaerobaculia bacterium]|nr:rhodanese-like domain-containing protein [Thermoanaerobaculia bacterium]